MRVLVTGGAGYLGSVLTRRLLKSGHDVRVMDKLVFGDEPIRGLDSNGHFQLVKGDITHIEDVTQAMSDIDAVIDLAAIVGDPACKLNHDLTVKTNYWATQVLTQVAASQGVHRFLFASTCSVYGLSEGGLAKEDGPTNPLSLYAETKADSERVLLDISGPMEPVILRLSTLCGPSYRMRFDLVLNIMTATAYFDKEVRVFGGSQVRPLLDVRDAARAFQTLLELPSGSLEHRVYNVGGRSQNVTILELGREVAAVMGNVKLVVSPEFEDQRSYGVDFSRVEHLGFALEHNLRDSALGIADLFESKKVVDYTDGRYYNFRNHY